MLSLKNSCLHPDTKKPYIVSSTGGYECSVEGMQVTRIIGVCSWLETSDEADSCAAWNHSRIRRWILVVANRDYYALKDPGHLAFGASLGPIVDSVQVVDF